MDSITLLYFGINGICPRTCCTLARSTNKAAQADRRAILENHGDESVGFYLDLYTISRFSESSRQMLFILLLMDVVRFENTIFSDRSA